MRNPIYSLLSLSTLLLAACGSDSKATATKADSGAPVVTTKIDRSGLTDVGTDPIDYADGNYWVCRPGNDKNECYENLDATAFLADGTNKVVPHVRDPNPKFDCFYVYPTVDLAGGGNTKDFSDISHVLDALRSQAARFSRICEVYAPLYRQQSIKVGGGGDAGAVGLAGDSNLGYGDVKAAFQYYLDHLSHGRKFVLMGHSQGTFMLSRLITDEFDGDANAALRSRMISALLIGGGPAVPAGKQVGGSFKNIPACATPGETGCLIAYNSFAAEAPPPANSLFGKAPAGQETVCTAPPPLAKNTGRSKGAYLPKVVNTIAFVPDTPPGALPDFSTPFAVFPDLFSGQCVSTGGFHYFEVKLDPAAGDQRKTGPYRGSVTESIGFGLHVSDYNLFLDDLIDAVKLQADAALR
jgi:hypothetical protein